MLTLFGFALSSLLVGPCALEFTRAKTADHFWSDPPADELIQRHRISSGNPTPPSCRRPILNFKRSLHSSEDGSTSSFKSNSSAAAKDYVESLHQNSRATLLYGKNNVLVLPVCNLNNKVNKPFILIPYARLFILCLSLSVFLYIFFVTVLCTLQLAPLASISKLISFTCKSALSIRFVERRNGTVAGLLKLASNTDFLNYQMDTESADEWLFGK